MRYFFFALVGCLFWFAHWTRLFRGSDGRGSVGCQAVLPLLALVCFVGCLAAPTGAFSGWSPALGGGDKWFWVFNFGTAFIVLVAVLVLELPVRAVARAVREARNSRQTQSRRSDALI